YLPITYDEYDLIRYYGNLVERYYVMKGFERLRPDLMLKYYDGSSEEIKVHYDEIVKVLSKEYHGKTVDFSVKKASFSGIDLMIIKELQKNPFMSPAEIGKNIGHPSVKVLRRLKSLVRDGIVGSIRVMKTPSIYDFVGTIIVEGLKVTFELIESLISIPFVSGISYSENAISIGVRLSRLGVSVLGDVVEYVGGKYDVHIYLMDPVVKASYTIPYLHEYSKYRADWVAAVSEREHG
ncbi:MAG TPA: winged helix-turn-helix domain-containing protein, partial [Desulfurococcaceae archaeon]|nr:winged helix-turn-helix domain-containing protein [Desulfurococcaceae archaeon]